MTKLNNKSNELNKVKHTHRINKDFLHFLIKKQEPQQPIHNIATEREFCDKCHSTVSYSEEGHLTCTNENCSIVYRDVLDHGSEWRSYGDIGDKDQSRCGMVNSSIFPESAFGTIILSNGKGNKELCMLKRVNQYNSTSHKDMAILHIFQTMMHHCLKANLPKKIAEEACVLYRKISPELASRSDTRTGAIAACVQLMCNKNEIAISPNEMKTIFNIKSNDLSSGSKMVENAINILKSRNEDSETYVTRSTVENYLKRYCAALQFIEEHKNICLYVAYSLDKLTKEDNSPCSLAPSIIYYVSIKCNMFVKKQDLAALAYVSDVTIAKGYGKICEYDVSLLFDSSIIEKYNIVN